MDTYGLGKSEDPGAQSHAKTNTKSNAGAFPLGQTGYLLVEIPSQFACVE